VALSAEKLLNFNSPGALVMGAEDAAEAALCLPLQCKVMQKATLLPCILNQMSEHTQVLYYLKFAIMCRKFFFSEKTARDLP